MVGRKEKQPIICFERAVSSFRRRLAVDVDLLNRNALVSLPHAPYQVAFRFNIYLWNYFPTTERCVRPKCVF
jgi:hypothetical protein